MAVADSLLVNVHANVAQAIAGLSAVETKIGLIQGLGAGMRGLGRSMTTFLTLPILAAGIGATSVASNFDDAFAKIEGLVGASEEQLEQYRDGILALAGPATRRGPQELADALYFVASAGFEGAEALDIVEKSAMAGAAGLGDTAVIADLTTSAMYAFRDSGLTATDAIDTLIAGVRAGKAEPDEFAAALGRVLPMASAMGIGFDEVVGQMAQMTRSGDDTAEAATKIRAAMASVLKPADMAEGAFENLGLSMDDVQTIVRDEGMPSLLAAVEGRMDDLGMSVNEQTRTWAELFPNVRALSGVLQQTGASAEGMDEVMATMESRAGSLQTAFGVAGLTVSEKMEIMQATISRLAITIGEKLLPAAAQILDVVIPIIEKFAEWFSQNSMLALSIAGIIAVVGPLTWAIGALLSPLGLILLGILAVVKVAQLFGVSWEDVMAVFNNVKAVIQAGLALLSGDTVGFAEIANTLPEKWGPAIAGVVEVIQGLLTFFRTEMLPVIMEVWETVRVIFQTASNVITAIVDGLLIIIRGIWERQGEEIWAFVQRLWERIKDIIRTALDIIRDIFKTIGALFRGDWEGFWDGIVDILGGIGDLLAQAFTLAWDVLTTVITTLGEEAVGLVVGIGKSIAQGIWDGLKSMGGWLFDQIMGWAASNIPGPILKLLGIASPSKVFAEYGRNIVQGLAQGIDSGQRDIRDAMNRLGERVKPQGELSPMRRAALRRSQTSSMSGDDRDGGRPGGVVIRQLVMYGLPEHIARDVARRLAQEIRFAA